MNMLAAFTLGLISLAALVAADVSHLTRNQQPHQQQQQQQQAFFTGNSRQNNPNYWWMNSETQQPFTKQTHNTNSAAGCNGCASRTLNIKHNTPQQHQQHQQQFHATQNHDYSHQNQFINAKSLVAPYKSIYTQSATVTGSPRDVNNFFAGQQQQQNNAGRIQTCTDSNSACVASKNCLNGFIERTAEAKAARSSVSLLLLFLGVCCVGGKQKLHSSIRHWARAC